jgi:hypothetical protein
VSAPVIPNVSISRSRFAYTVATWTTWRSGDTWYSRSRTRVPQQGIQRGVIPLAPINPVVEPGTWSCSTHNCGRYATINGMVVGLATEGPCEIGEQGRTKFVRDHPTTWNTTLARVATREDFRLPANE